jgi:hypothetical protein
MSAARRAIVGGLLGCGLLAAPAALAAEGAPPSVRPLVGAGAVRTLVNLHPDEARAKLYAVNYQQAGLIPACSEVRLLSLDDDRLRFQVVKTGKEYAYDFHKAAGEPFEIHLGRFFGRECDSKAIAALRGKDREGVERGVVMPGMTKRGVLFALGPPPRHVTPDLDSTRWRYWKNRFDTMIVVFDARGVVAAIEN